MNYLLSYEVDGDWERKLFDTEAELKFFMKRIEEDADYIVDEVGGLSNKGTALDFILSESTNLTVAVKQDEKKTKRGNLLFTPSVYEDMQILAELEDTSFNNLLHELAKDYISKRADEVKRYKKKQKLVDDILTML